VKVLFLGKNGSSLRSFLSAEGVAVVQREEPIDVEWLVKCDPDLIISYGYRHFIRKPVIVSARRPIINLHVSLLPWNRGADPNLWSFLEDSPKGVTIHEMDAGLDTGPIIAQEVVDFVSPHDTLATTYQILSEAIEDLFRRWWGRIKVGNYIARQQPQGGSYHRAADKEQFQFLLADGWNTRVLDLVGKAKVG